MPAYDANVGSALALLSGNKVLRFAAHDAVNHLAIINQFMPVGTWELNVASDDMRWSKETFAIHGLPVEDGPIDIKRALAFYIEPDLKALANLIQQAIRSASGFRSSLRLRRADGALRVVETFAAPVVTASGAVVKLVGTSRDITDFASCENVRTAHQDLLLRMITSSPAPVAMFDRQMRYVTLCDAWKTTFGIAADQIVIGQRHADLAPDSAQSLQPYFELALRGQPMGKNNDRLIVTDRLSLGCDWIMQPWSDHTCQTAGVVIMLKVKFKTVGAADEKVLRLERGWTPAQHDPDPA